MLFRLIALLYAEKVHESRAFATLGEPKYAADSSHFDYADSPRRKAVA